MTGFLGPNGAGKTTTLRVLLGLARADTGGGAFDGAPYRDLHAPLHTVGALLEGAGYHPGRSGRDHLRVLAAGGGLPPGRVDALLDLMALGEVADRRAGGYSQGMRQRLGLAAALLGDPSCLVLDEPANGLDPQGVRWLRDFLRRAVLEASGLAVEPDPDGVLEGAPGRRRAGRGCRRTRRGQPVRADRGGPLGIVGSAWELRHGTMTATLPATPRRGYVVGVKLAVYAAAGLLLGACRPRWRSRSSSRCCASARCCWRWPPR